MANFCTSFLYAHSCSFHFSRLPSPSFFFFLLFCFFPGFCRSYADVFLEVHCLCLFHALHRQLHRCPAVSLWALDSVNFFLRVVSRLSSCTLFQNFVQPPTRTDVVQSQRLANRRPARWDVNNNVRAGGQNRAEPLRQKSITTCNISLLLTNCI